MIDDYFMDVIKKTSTIEYEATDEFYISIFLEDEYNLYGIDLFKIYKNFDILYSVDVFNSYINFSYYNEWNNRVPMNDVQHIHNSLNSTDDIIFQLTFQYSHSMIQSVKILSELYRHLNMEFKFS